MNFPMLPQIMATGMSDLTVSIYAAGVSIVVDSDLDKY